MSSNTPVAITTATTEPTIPDADDETKINEAVTMLNFRLVDDYTTGEWGKFAGQLNEPVQMHFLTKNQVPCEKSNEANNSPGFDFTCRGDNLGQLYADPTPPHIFEKRNQRIQAKLRSVKGLDAFNKQVDITTTRRNSKKNKDLGATESGHCVYGSNEFDAILVSLIWGGKESELKLTTLKNVRKNPNKWQFSLIPVYELIDNNNDKILRKVVSSTLLRKYRLKKQTNWCPGPGLGRDDLLAAKDAEIAALKAQLAAKDAEIAALKAQLAAQSKQHRAQ